MMPQNLFHPIVVSSVWVAEHFCFQLSADQEQLFHFRAPAPRPTSFQHNSTTVWKPHRVEFHTWKPIETFTAMET